MPRLEPNQEKDGYGHVTMASAGRCLDDYYAAVAQTSNPNINWARRSLAALERRLQRARAELDAMESK